VNRDLVPGVRRKVRGPQLRLTRKPTPKLMVVPPPCLGSTQKSITFWKLVFDSKKPIWFRTLASSAIR